MKTPARGIYAITDCQNLETEQIFDVTEKIVQTGIAMLQYRDKHADHELRVCRASRLRKLCSARQVPFIVNDNIELALAVGADGVHLGKEDMDLAGARERLGKDSIIGISCYNNLENAIAAHRQGADYVAFGSFFTSRTKPDAVRATPDVLVKAKNAIDIPLVAIGGITQENGNILIQAGADLLAISNGLYSGCDPGQAVRIFNNLFDAKMENHHL